MNDYFLPNPAIGLEFDNEFVKNPPTGAGEIDLSCDPFGKMFETAEVQKARPIQTSSLGRTSEEFIHKEMLKAIVADDDLNAPEQVVKPSGDVKFDLWRAEVKLGLTRSTYDVWLEKRK